MKTVKIADLISMQPIKSPTGQTFTLRTHTPRADVDLLAVSAYLFRMYHDDPANRFQDLCHTARYTPIYDQDHERAREIADYFSKQIMLAQLRGDAISDWQRSVAKFINSDRRQIENPGIGMGLIHRLPEYYESDLAVRQIFNEHFDQHQYIDMIGPFLYARKLLPLSTVTHHTRNEKVTQYWLKDHETGNPVMLKVDSKNQLKYLWDRVFDRGNYVDIEGTFSNYVHHLGVSYTNSRNWRLVPE